MSMLSAEQIATLCSKHGFGDGKNDKGELDRNSMLVRAVAIVLAESGGDTLAVGVNKDGTRDRGLWQLNDKWNPTVTDADAFNADKSTEIAYGLATSGAKWGRWSSHTNGAADRQLNTAYIAVGRGTQLSTVTYPTQTDGWSPTLPNPGDIMSKVGSLFNTSLAFLLGIALLILGVVLLARNQVGKIVTGAVSGATTGAAVKPSVEQRAQASVDYSLARKRIMDDLQKQRRDEAFSKLRKVER